MADPDNPATITPTPILDSGVLPPRIRQVKLSNVVGGFLAGILPGILFIVIGREANERLNFGLGILSFITVLILAITLHELGHLLAGWAVGFRFSSIQIGPFSLRIEHGLLKARFHREMTVLGYAGMHVNRLPQLRRRLLIYIAAGPTINLLCVPATVLLVNNAFPELGITWVATPAAQFAVISLLLGVLSLVPRSSLIAYSDGARIAMLRSRDRTRRWLSIIALARVYNLGTHPKLWKESWLKAACSLNDTSRDRYVGNLFAYFSASDRKDAPAAGGHLEKCLELAGNTPTSNREFLAQEAAVFTAWYRNDASLAEKWCTQLQKPGLLSRLAQIRMHVAMRCARKDFDGALAGWQEGHAFIDSATLGSARKLMTESWLEWRDEILERQHQAATTEGSAG